MTLEVVEVSIDDVVAMVARRLGTQSTESGGLYFIGKLRPEDRGTLVRRVPELSREDAVSVSRLFASDNGRSTVTGGGLLIAGDTVEVLSRMSEVMDAIQELDRVVWVAKLHVLAIDSQDVDRFGLTSSAGVRGSLFASSLGLVTPAAQVTLESALEAVERSSASRVMAQNMFVLNDGQRGTYQRGQRVPITESIIVEQRVSESTRLIDVGFNVEIEVASLDEGDAVLRLRVADERVVEVRDGQPVIDGFTYSGETDVVSGETYLVAELDVSSRDRSAWSRLGFGRSSGVRSSVAQIWVEVFRLGNEHHEGGPGSGLSGPAAEVDAWTES